MTTPNPSNGNNVESPAARPDGPTRVERAQEAPSILAVLRRRWYIAVLLTAIGMLLGFAAASRSADEWQARTRVLVGPYETDLDTLRASSGLAQTYAGLATSDAILDRVSERLGVDVEDALTEVSATANDVTRIATIRVVDDDAELAASVANAIADELATISAGSPLQTGAVTILDAASADRSTNQKQGTLIIALWTLGGFSLGLVASMLAHNADRKVRDAAGAARVTGLSPLGRITLRPSSSGDKRPGRAESTAAALRRVVAPVVMDTARPTRILAIVPAERGEHTEIVTADIGDAISSTGRSVLVIADGNGDATGRLPSRGLGQVLGQSGLPDEARKLRPGSWAMIRTDLRAPLTLGPVDVEHLLARLVESVDTVVFVLPPAEECPAASTVLANADHALIIAQLGRTRLDDLAETATTLQRPASLILIERSLGWRMAPMASAAATTNHSDPSAAIARANTGS